MVGNDVLEWVNYYVYLGTLFKYNNKFNICKSKLVTHVKHTKVQKYELSLDI